METRFRDRLGYARWRYHLRHGAYPGNAEIARAVDVTGPWVTKWSQRDDAPDSRGLGRALSAFLECPESWLMDDEGEPPDPDLYERWRVARGYPAPKRVSRTPLLDALPDMPEDLEDVTPGRVAPAPARRRKANGGR